MGKRVTTGTIGRHTVEDATAIPMTGIKHAGYTGGVEDDPVRTGFIASSSWNSLTKPAQDGF